MFSGVEVRALFFTSALAKNLALCTGHCHARTYLGPLVLVKRNLNTTTYKGILHNCVFPTLCFGEEPHIVVMVYILLAV